MGGFQLAQRAQLPLPNCVVVAAVSRPRGLRSASWVSTRCTRPERRRGDRGRVGLRATRSCNAGAELLPRPAERRGRRLWTGLGPGGRRHLAKGLVKNLLRADRHRHHSRLRGYISEEAFIILQQSVMSEGPKGTLECPPQTLCEIVPERTSRCAPDLHKVLDGSALLPMWLRAPSHALRSLRTVEGTWRCIRR